ncbi:hypothetical protein B0H10DRAFT_1939266 [Mycena sp. CBHHK59/15]|nr:hypothetical protein B0H10DRAFT_1939266 [Mycena sp. CBHHK59/15]
MNMGDMGPEFAVQALQSAPEWRGGPFRRVWTASVKMGRLGGTGPVEPAVHAGELRRAKHGCRTRESKSWRVHFELVEGEGASPNRDSRKRRLGSSPNARDGPRCGLCGRGLSRDTGRRPCASVERSQRCLRGKTKMSRSSADVSCGRCRPMSAGITLKLTRQRSRDGASSRVTDTHGECAHEPRETTAAALCG